jgi:hypothetical protein
MMMLERRLKRAFLSGQVFAIRRHRDEMQAERDRMPAELATIKSNLVSDYMNLRVELDAALAELYKLRALHATSKAQRAEIWRLRMLATAAAAERDPAALLN